MSHGFHVLVNDYGIRPAGQADECFYCQRKVGHVHADDCVCIVRDVTYRVLRGGRELGMWTRPDPASWSPEDCEQHKNESSWCADNLLNTGTPSSGLVAALDAIAGGGCLCSRVHLRVATVSPEIRRDGP